ncbi:uncharacterized protein CBL_00812 [Carabus blaptoides fortunei]
MDIIDLLSICLPVLAFICVVLVILLNIYIKLRPKCSVNVNCWFCNQWTKVVYELQNSWDCPFCEQYNGFTEDGDYNKPIPAQHDELMNKQVSSAVGASTTPNNGLCNSCNNNQQLKIHQLAMFSPIDESKFDEEIERYQKQLERAYRLCPQCEKTVKRTLHKQKSLLLGIRLSTLRKQGLDYLDLNKSHPGISKTAKRKFFLTAMRYTIVALAVIRLVDILKSCDFSNKNITKSLPGTVVPYILLGKDLLLLLQNVVLSLYECVQYLTAVIFQNRVSTLNDTAHMYLSICNLSYIKTTMSHVFIFDIVGMNRSTILTSVGTFMQVVLMLFNKGVGKVDYVKCVAWVLLMLSGTGQLNISYAQISISPKLVQIILCCFLVTIPSSTQETKKLKMASGTKKKTSIASLENDFSDEEIQPENGVDMLNSTFKSTCSHLNTSLNSSRSVSPFNHTSASTLKLFSVAGKKIENESLHVFGKQPVFENPLITSYFKFSPKFRSAGSLCDSYSTKKSTVNDSLNSSFYSDKLEESLIFSANGSGEIRPELELNKGLSDLHLGTYPSAKKYNNTDIPPVFRVSSPVLTRPKNVLSPPRLGNVTQSSWVAGGYWKSSNEFTNNSGSFSNLSRSSSQSSGFGSQASNQQQANFENTTIFNSLPSSRNNSVCGEFDKFSVFSEPAYHYNTNKNMCNANRVYPVFKPDQQIYICPKSANRVGPPRVCNSPSQNHSVLNDTFWSTTSSNSFAFPAMTCNRPSSRESNLSQTNFNGSPNKCSTYNHNSTFNSQLSYNLANPFYSQPTIFAVNNTRPVSASTNRTTFPTKTYVKGSLLKKWREQNDTQIAH